LVVNSTADAVDANIGDGSCLTSGGVCTLRAAIQEANATPGADKINFNIPPGNQQTITVGNLPAISEAVTMDATTQPGFNTTTNVPLIALTSNAAGSGFGLLFTHATGTSTVRGLVINNFSIGMIIGTSGTGLVQVKGNYIGTDATGTSAVGNTRGVAISSSTNNLIGGTTAADRNVISGNTTGVLIQNGTNNTVIGNYIGTNAAGTAAVSNSDGVYITSAPNNLIGGVGAGEANIIAFNYNGVVVTVATATGNAIRGNAIFSNVNTGIDQGDNGSIETNDAGDADTGPNNL